MSQIKVALLSCTDKTGLDRLGSFLHEQGVTLLASGGTASYLEKQDLPVKRVEDWTGAPEMLEGRVKTLHPRIHAGILHRRDNNDDVNCLKQMELQGIDLVVVNLYAFEANPTESNIDIGGPTMIRAAAKNHQFVTVLSDPEQYKEFQEEFQTNKGSTSKEFRKTCAAKVFQHMHHYDGMIAKHLGGEGEHLDLRHKKVTSLRYGENPQQTATLYTPDGKLPFEQHQGKELSYNNYADMQTVVDMMAATKNYFANREEKNACVVVKHQNPCGFALETTPLKAWESALAGDPQAAFGGIVAVNFEPTEEVAQAWAKMFLEVIIAPSWPKEALEVFAKKKNIRLLTWPEYREPPTQWKSWQTGMLVQSTDRFEERHTWEVKTKTKPTTEQQRAAELGWFVSRFIKSNAIVAAQPNRLIAAGAGQMSRIDAIKIVKRKLKEQKDLDLKKITIASDAFFPFADSIEELAELNINCIIQPTGSVRDEEVIEASNKNQISMIATNHRHFFH